MTAVNKEDFGSSVSLSWSLKADSVGVAMQEGALVNRTVQVGGDFSGLACVVIEGSNLGGGDENWFPLTDKYGAPLRLASAGLYSISECPRMTRPRVEGGDAETLINICIFAMRGPR